MQQPALSPPSPGHAGGFGPPVVLRLLQVVASLKLTLLLLVMLAPAVVLAYNLEEWRSWPLAIPLAGLAANLLAALTTNPVFRRQTALIAFHLSLVALLLLIALGRLSYLKGTLELTEGAIFEGELNTADAGPLHIGALDEVRFTHDGFDIDYAPGIQRGSTRNRVRWLDDEGHWRRAIVGDQHALVIKRYRFYTSHNKGFAPTFRFTPTTGEAVLGSVHLPSYPIHEYGQAQEWPLPDTDRKLWILLDFDEVILDPENPSVFRLPSEYSVVVRDGERRHELKPGDSIDLPEGRLTLTGLRSWMGYNVFYDWTLPWLAATGALAVICLGAHFIGKFSRKPWDA